MAETFQGIGVSPGVAIGPVYVLAPTMTVTHARGTPEEERTAFEVAVSRAVQQVEFIAAKLRTDGLHSEAGIMDAQILMLQDPGLGARVRERVARGATAYEAVDAAAAEFKMAFEALDDPYMAARAADVQDIADRINRALHTDIEFAPPTEPCIVIARDLTPSQTAAMDRSVVLGFATDAGSPTSHTAILSQALGLPAVVGLRDLSSRVRAGQQVALDGHQGTVIIDPSPEERLLFASRGQAHADSVERLTFLRDEPAVTLDRRRITLAANIGSPADLPSALDVGAEGIGLFRTEFLFADRDGMPSEDVQETAYRSVVSAFPHKVVIRTLDIGGDKPLSYLPQNVEANPFLGLRGVRYTLAHVDVLRTQLRALFRASHAGRLAIMFPMVSELEQIERVRQLVSDARKEVGGDAEIGIMIEIPAAALIADRLARHVDFFSVGTNDLVQYSLAVDRINEHVAPLYQPLHPAVIRLLQSTVEGGRQHGRWVGVCGEMAGDLSAIPLLVGLGFDELSMTPSRIPAAKERIRELEFAACAALAAQAVECETSAEVDALVRSFLPSTVPAKE